MRYTLKPGIAAIVNVCTSEGVEYSVISLRDDVITTHRGFHMSKDFSSELPQAVITVCKDWFAKVFAQPEDKRGIFIKEHGKLPVIEV